MSSKARDICFNWVIEALAYYEQIDPSTLVGLVKKASGISDDTGKDAREMVSFKILESMFVHGNEASVDNEKIHFDPSERCEDVLRRILDETSKPERAKWDVASFIMHKKSSLAECFLKKLKEAIVEGSHPLLASLKEKSKLIGPVADANCGSQIPLNPESENNKFQENPSQNCSQAKCSNGETIREECEMSIEPLKEGLNETPFVDKKSVEENGSNEARNCILHDDDEIAAKKVAFLSSQDSMEWTEIELCTKCNEGGQLLVCTSDACPLRLHESCLHSVATFDENGKFLCPFCAYSRAIAKYAEAKTMASLARKDLQAFLGFGVEKRPNISSDLEKNGSRETRVLGDETIEENGNNREKEAEMLGEPSRLCGENGGDKEAEMVGTKVVEECQSPTRMEETVSSVRSKSARMGKKKGSATSISSTPSRNLRKRKAQHISPALPLARRNILPWTKSEEEILKEGVQRFWSVENKGIPWREILEFGGGVFHKGRTTIDLKDKWRNICKGSPKSK